MTSAARSVQQSPKSAFAFEVENLHRVYNQRTFIAAFDVVLPGIKIFDCRLHVSKSRRFVGGPGRPAGWLPERWKTLALFDDDVAAAILETVEARLEVLVDDEQDEQGDGAA